MKLQEVCVKATVGVPGLPQVEESLYTAFILGASVTVVAFVRSVQASVL